MSTATETAEAFLHVLRTLGRWLLWLLLIVVGLALIGLGIYWGYDWYTYQHPKSQIKLTANIGQTCKGEYPVFVGVINDSAKTILSYTFDVVARQKGYSKNLARSYETYSDDKVLGPNEGYGTCWRIIKDGANYPKVEYLEDTSLEVSVVNFSPSFE
jgi:hypothetical protein